MKQLFPILVLLSFGAAAPAFGQGTTKLLTAKTQLSLDFATGQISLGDSTTYSYNNIYHITQTRFWNYDAGAAIWRLERRLTDYSYDANGNLLSVTEQHGNDTNGWVNFARTTNTFDGNNHQLTAISETWSGAAWVVDNTLNWVYDVNGNVLSQTSDEIRYLFTYNAEGLLDMLTQQSFIFGNWENIYRTLYTYIPNDTDLASVTTQEWANSAWENYSRTSYTYNANGNAVVTLDETWITGAWENIGNLLSDYDADQNLVHWVSQYWSGTAWEDVIQMIAEYDDESNILKSRWEYNFGVWQPITLFGYYYTEFVSANAPMLTDFQIFPNPTSSFIVLKSQGFEQAKIFDTRGQLLRTQGLSGQAEETIRVGDLPVGNYFLQVTSADGKTGVKSLQIRH